MGVDVNYHLGPYIAMNKIIKIWNHAQFKCIKHGNLEFSESDKYCSACGSKLVNDPVERKRRVRLFDLLENMDVPTGLYCDLAIDDGYDDGHLEGEDYIFDEYIHCDEYDNFNPDTISKNMDRFKDKYGDLMSILEAQNIPFVLKFGFFEYYT